MTLPIISTSGPMGLRTFRPLFWSQTLSEKRLVLTQESRRIFSSLGLTGSMEINLLTLLVPRSSFSDTSVRISRPNAAAITQ